MPQFRRNQVADDIIDGAKVEDGTLTGDDIQDGTIKSDDLENVYEAKIVYDNKTRNVFIPGPAFFSGSGAPTQVTWAAGTVGFEVWSLANAVSGALDTYWALPEDYKGGTDIVLETWWASSITNNNNIVIRSRVLRMQNSTIAGAGDYSSYYTVYMGTANAVRKHSHTITGTGWAAGEPLVFRIYRYGAHASDTYTGDGYFLGMNIKYTSDRRGS